MATQPFTFPREYHYPPFFTRQTNLTIHHAQLVKWTDLILAYCKHHRIYKLSLSSAVPDTSASSSTEELFHNKKLNKRLSLADTREVLDFMRKDGRAEPVAKDGAGDVVWVYWRTPEEWAAIVEAWIDGTAQKGVVMTLYELTEGEGARGTEFYGLDPEILLKALHILVKRGKAQIFGQEDSQGVKFF